MGSLPSAQLIPALSEKQEAEEGWRGRWQDPDQIPRTLPAFVAMVMLLFLSRSRCSKPSLSLFQRGQPGSALTLQCSIFSPRKSSDGRKGHPLGRPSTRGLFSGVALHLGAFWFPVSVLSFMFSGSNSPCLPETLLQTRSPPAETPVLPWETRRGSEEHPVRTTTVPLTGWRASFALIINALSITGGSKPALPSPLPSTKGRGSGTCCLCPVFMPKAN